MRSTRFLILGLSLLPTLTVFGKEYRALKGESTLSYVLVHPAHTVKGVTRDFDVTVDLAPDTVSSKIAVSAAVKTFDSGNSNRDSHALEAIHGLKYPRVEFVSDSVRTDTGGYRVMGRLTFAGQTRPVAFKVVPTFHKDKVEIKGGFAVKLSDFKVKRPSLLFVPTQDKLTIRFDVFSKLD